MPIRLLVLLCSLLVLPAGWCAAASAAAEDGAEEPITDPQEVRYVPLQPTFVANFGTSDNGRLQFLRADVALRVSSQEAAAAVNYHMPALRNAIVLLLSRQDEATVSTGAGREAMRAEALGELRAILVAEEGEAFIEDVLFTNFIVQR